MRFERKHLFWAFWVLAAVVVAVIYFRYETNSDFIGLVESRSHSLGVSEAGRIEKILVAQGQNVSAGQVLVELDMSDLDAEQELLHNELDRRQSLLESDRVRYGVEFDKLMTQSRSDDLNMSLRQIDLVEAKAELDALNVEIDRLQQAQNAGLGRSRDLAELTIRRDTLRRVIAARKAVLAGRSSQSRTVDMDQARQAFIDSMLGEHYERMSEIKVSLQAVMARRAARTVVSPVNGRVISIVNMPGDTVDRYLPIVTVAQTTVSYLDAYVPETSGQLPVVGQKVNLYPHRQMARNSTGTIVSVDPGYSVIPERLAFRGQFYWARKFRVQMDDNHGLMPGEAVRVEMRDHSIGVGDALAGAIDQGPPPESQDTGPEPSGATSESGQDTAAEGLKPVVYRPAAGFTGSFEPSGMVWLDDIERFLIVSDDTGKGPTRHAPWLFLMDRDGVVESVPVLLRGIDEVNDLEAVTVSSTGHIYLVSSNNVNRKGRRKTTRQNILKVQRTGRDFQVVGKVALYDAIMKSCDPSVIGGLGLGKVASGGDGLELNIEGAAYDESGDGPAMLLGLKQPVSGRGAIIWRLSDPDSLMETGRLKPGQLTLAAVVDLGVSGSLRSSISDLAVRKDGTICGTSTVPMAGDSTQIGRLFCIERLNAAGVKADIIAEYPGLKPEGLAVFENDEEQDWYCLIMDAGDEESSFFQGRWSR